MSGTSLRRLTRLDIGTERHFRWLAWIVGAVLVLNGLDAAFTLLWVHTGLASEGNLLFERLVSDRPVLFVAVKMTLVALGSALLWMRRTRPAAVLAIFAVFLIYYALLLYHIGFAARMLPPRW